MHDDQLDEMLGQLAGSVHAVKTLGNDDEVPLLAPEHDIPLIPAIATHFNARESGCG